MSAQDYPDLDTVGPLVMIGWEDKGALVLRGFRVDTDLLNQEYDGDLVTYIQEVYAPPFEWHFEL